MWLRRSCPTLLPSAESRVLPAPRQACQNATALLNRRTSGGARVSSGGLRSFAVRGRTPGSRPLLLEVARVRVGINATRTFHAMPNGLGRCSGRRGFASVGSAVVEVYTVSWCPYCERIRNLLKRKGVQYTEIDVSESSIKEQMIKRTNGKKTVPQLFINGEYIGDCDGTHKLDAQGLLDEKLGLKKTAA